MTHGGKFPEGCHLLRNVLLPDEVATWTLELARSRGVGVGKVVEEALLFLRDDINSPINR